MTGGARISQLQVTDPESVLSQQDVLALLGLEGDQFAEGIFSRSAVGTRDFGPDPHALERTLQGRTAQIERQLFDYAVSAIDRLDVDPASIQTVVTSSLYSLGGPTLAHRLVEHLGMDAATDKYHVVGVGCASAVPLIRLAGQSVSAQPGTKGLVVAAESMSGLLMPAMAGDTRSKTVGSAIFGDGCAAALIETGDTVPGPLIAASKVHQIPGTLDVVRMELSDDDSYLHMDRRLPELASAGLAELVDGFLQSSALALKDIDHWIIHPGGRRILERVEESLGLSREQIEVSYDVLARRGNVGTPSIFYVLNETITQREPARGERGLMVTVGPGVTVGLMLLIF